MSEVALPEIPAPDTSTWPAIVARAEPEMQEIVRQMSDTIAGLMALAETMQSTNEALRDENDKLRLCGSSVAGRA